MDVSLFLDVISLLYSSNIILTFTATNDNGIFLPYTEYDAAKRRTVKTHLEPDLSYFRPVWHCVRQLKIVINIT